MKKFLSILVILACMAVNIRADESPLKLSTIKKSEYGMISRFNDFPRDRNNGEISALIRVFCENMTKEEARALKFRFGSTTSVVEIRDSLNSGDPCLWVFVAPTKESHIEVVSDMIYSNQQPTGQLESKGVYEVTVTNEKMVTVTIKVEPKDAQIYIDDLRADANGVVQNVHQGKHRLKIIANGTPHEEEIEVSEGLGQTFSRDFRPNVDVIIKADKGAQIFIQDEVSGKFNQIGTIDKESISVTRPVGSTLNIKATLNGESDQKSVAVAPYGNEYVLEPVKRKTFEVYATYGGRKVPASLYVDGKRIGNADQSSFPLTYPVGRQYRMEMTYSGRSKERTIKVRNNMDASYEFKISARNSFVWPWQKEFDPVAGGVSIGYVRKQYVTSGEGEKLKENIWGDEGKWMHGMQFGFHMEPAFHWGLGLYTGLFYEFYISSSDSWGPDSYTDFMEHCLYLPVHAYFRLPLARKVMIAVHGGIGMDYAVAGAFSTGDDYYEDYTDFYGEDYFPNRFNLSGEISVDLRFGPVAITGTYSKGLLDHKSYTSIGDFKTVQNKMSIAVSWVIGK